MKKLIYTLSILFISSGLFAQDLVEALRYSSYKLSGTARSTAMGNAFGALGGDFSSLSINPAGLGVYRSGEFAFSLDVNNVNADGTYLDKKVSDSKYNLSFDNISYVATHKPSVESSGMVSLNFGIGFNRLNNFSMNMMAEGDNAQNSILTGFTNYVNDEYIGNDDFHPYYEGLAWDTYLMDYNEDNDEYYNDLSDYGYGQSQRKLTERRGYINEFNFSLAANFNHKFYIGATLGIHDVYYEENTNHFEYDRNNEIDYFNELNFLTNLTTTGTGFNFKIGAIYKPVNELRLGIALHSPTFYSLNDDYYNAMFSNMTFDDGTHDYSSYSPDGYYDYKMETPLKAVLSAAYVIGKKALISVDYEYVDYSKSKLRNGSDGNDFVDENNDIAAIYKSVGNLRIGGEYRVNNNLSLRAGYENYPSAFNATAFGVTQDNSKTKYSSVSTGLGFKFGNTTLDLAYKHVMDEEYNTLYAGSEFANYQISKDKLILTLGFKF